MNGKCLRGTLEKTDPVHLLDHPSCRPSKIALPLLSLLRVCTSWPRVGGHGKSQEQHINWLDVTFGGRDRSAPSVTVQPECPKGDNPLRLGLVLNNAQELVQEAITTETLEIVSKM